jgi:uncharacterized protein YndB with AHSA1/START domain
LSETNEGSDFMPPVLNEQVRMVDLNLEYAIAAPPARVWRIMTQRTNEWWKRASFYLRPDAVAIHMELRAGGRVWEEYADGGSVLWWTINEVIPEKALSFLSTYGSGADGHHQEVTRVELIATDKGCTVKLRQSLMGVISDRGESIKPFVGGWNQLFEDGLRPMAEEGD